MSRYTNLIFLVLLALSGCNQQTTSVPEISAEDGTPLLSEAQYGDRNPLIIETYLPARCGPVESKNVSPTEYEQGEFSRRLQEVKPLSQQAVGVTSAIDIGCITRRYKSDDLRAWATRGDPVAMYGELVNKYRRLGDVCRNDEAITVGLDRAYNAKFVIIEDVRISRLPELHYLIGIVKFNCGRKGGAQYLLEASDRGYFLPQILPD